ncbi:peptide transporter PTR2A [Mycena belliarum]|uniref:Peptide transporter PTR2A n=1 Tax=Mycena belliarum TaxID=1033014 RepID=A0AAD6TSY5_9AGAR|nr:peptide transporter PTR2A [Mycena belliae]
MHVGGDRLLLHLHDTDGIHDGLVRPTEEERLTLRRVADTIPWNAYLIALVELAERFSFYGAGVVFTNFIQYPLPAGSHTGAGLRDGQSGALGKGQQASTGITTFYQFWCVCYVTPFLGAYIADVHLGRYNTICVAVGVALIGHIILIIAAVPGVIEYPDTALLVFLVALVIMGFGTGLFKANISPLVAEQYKRTKLFVITTAGGEQVIVDPALTVSRIYMYFYLMINVGSLLGQIGMTYSEKYIGFWLAYTLPTVVFLLCPIILFIGRKRYIRAAPTGSIFATFIRLFRFAAKGRWHLNPLRTYRSITAPDFWDAAKPSRLSPAARPGWMTFDDEWVDEVQRGLKACAVFAWFPVYWLTANQLNNNLTSQAATMTTDGLPNDILSNIDPFTLIIFIPLSDFFFYPALQRRGIKFTSLKRITAGFLTGSTAMIWAAVLQYNIYQTNPCQYAAATCHDAAQRPLVSPLSVWLQAPAYVLVALSEILAAITGLEYAYTKAPGNMRSLVMSLFLFTSAVSAALGEGFLWLAADPLLVWNYVVMAGLAGIGGGAFWLAMRGLDAREDELNSLAAGRVGKDVDLDDDPASYTALDREE